jgi:hypothetical protein
MAVEMIVRPTAVTVEVFQVSFFLSFLARFGLIVWYVEYIRIRAPRVSVVIKSLTSPSNEILSRYQTPAPFEGENLPPIYY